MTQISQDVALGLQLAAFAGNEPSGSVLELRYKAGTGWGQTFFPVRDLDALVRVIDWRGKRVDVYVGAAPRTRHEGTAKAVERVWCLWVDCDGPVALKRLAEFRPLPSLVVRSGSDGSAHGYWPLRSPLTPAWAQRANRRLALAIGADMVATDAARILRPVGSRNHKHTPAREVRCTRLELDVFTFDQVVGSLPDDRSYTPPSCPRQRPVDAEPSRLLDGLVRTVQDATVGNRNAMLYWAGCRVNEHAAAGSLEPDLAVESLREAALAAGLTEHEVDRTLHSAATVARAAA